MGLCLVLVGCGEPTGPGSLVRVDLVPGPDAPPWPQLAELAELSFPGDWTADAPVAEQGPAGTWRVSDPKGAAPLSVSLRGAFHLSAFDVVVVGVAAAGPGELQVELWDGGDLVGLTRPQPVIVSDDLAWLHLPAHLFWHRDRRADRLVLKAHASVHRLDLAALKLFRQPVGAALPDPAGPPILVDLWGEARQAEGLIEGMTLTAPLRVPDEGRLSFSHLWEPLHGPGGDAPSLHVQVTAGERVVARRFERPDAAGQDATWTHEQLDLGRLAGASAELSMRLESGGGLPAACAIGELTLWSPTARPATVVLVTSDTHRADHLAAAPGSVDLATPTLDALAARGVLFSDCLSTTNVTNPSHGALLSGLHPAETGILHNSLPLGDGAATLAEAFAAAGWATAAVVSARHLGHPTSGLGQGFDRMSWPHGGGARSVEQTVPLAEQALDAADGRPLFLWVHLFDAHGPYKPPERWERRYWPDDRDPWDATLPDPPAPLSVLPPTLEGLRDFDYPAAAYRGEVSRLDEGLAPLLSRERVARGTVAVTADHGESFGQHGIWFTHAGLYPDTIHVPLVLAFPEAPAGLTVDAPVGHLDLAATLLELSGVDPGGVPGRSFAPLARGQGVAPAPRFALSAHGFAASVTDGGWHLVLHLRPQRQPQMTSSFERHQVQLYDLRADPGCRDDVWQRELPRARALRAGLVNWLSTREDLGLAGELVQDAERSAQLRELGYLEDTSADRVELWVDDTCAWCAHFAEEPGR